MRTSSTVPAEGPSEWRLYPPSVKLDRSVYPTITDGNQSGLRRNRRGDGRHRQRVRAACPAIRDVAGANRRHRSRRVDGAAHGRRRAVAETSRGGGRQPGGSGVPDPVVRGEGQPDGVGRHRFKERDLVDLLARYGVDDDRTGGVPRPGPAGQCAGVVATLRGPVAVVVRDVRGHGARGLGDPHLRGAVRARAAADRRVRPLRVPARAQRPGGGGAPCRPPSRAARSC